MEATSMEKLLVGLEVFIKNMNQALQDLSKLLTEAKKESASQAYFMLRCRRRLWSAQLVES